MVDDTKNDDAQAPKRLTVGRRITAELCELAALITRGAIQSTLLAARLRELAEEADGGKQQSLPGITSPLDRAIKAESATIDRVFAEWQKLLNHPKARKTDERKDLVRARLREGYTELELLSAIRGLSMSEWHIKNDQTEFDIVMREGTRVEKFMRIASGAVVNLEGDPEADRLREQASGRFDEQGVE
jgi:hypothetical protein